MIHRRGGDRGRGTAPESQVERGDRVVRNRDVKALQRFQQFRNDRFGVLAASLAALGGLACGSKAPPRPAHPAVVVTLATARRADVPYDIEANGIVTPMQSAAVVPQVDGILTDVDFAEGQVVSKGQVLFKIDPRPYQAAYDQAQATLKRDRATAAYAAEESARYDTLALTRSVTQEQADQQRATAQASAASVDADQAAVATAKFNLDNTVIRAPIGGRTGALLVRVGNVVHASGAQPLVVINQVQPTLVRFAVPGSSLPMILRYGSRGGLPVTAVPSDAPSAARDTATRLDAPAPQGTPVSGSPRDTSEAANPDEHGNLSFIDNAVDTTTATLLLKATFPNRSGTLWAGQFVSTTLRLFVEDSALVIPTAAIVAGQNGNYVWVIDSANTADERAVTVERAAGDLSIIASGLHDGDRVVTIGQSRLTPGAPVTLDTGAPVASTGGRRGRGRGGRGRGNRARGTS